MLISCTFKKIFQMWFLKFEHQYMSFYSLTQLKNRKQNFLLLSLHAIAITITSNSMFIFKKCDRPPQTQTARKVGITFLNKTKYDLIYQNERKAKGFLYSLMISNSNVLICYKNRLLPFVFAKSYDILFKKLMPTLLAVCGGRLQMWLALT